MRLLLSALLLVLVFPVAAARGGVDEQERWYVIEIQGQRSGWMRESLRKDDGNIRSEMQMHLEFGRGAVRGEAGIETYFVETPGGEPVEMSMTQRLGGIPNTTSFVFTGDGVEMTGANAGQTYSQTLPKPTVECLTPHAALADLERRLAAGEKEITQITLTPLTGVAPVKTTMRVLGEENIEVFGRSVPALRTSIETSVMPGAESVQHISPDGRILRTVQDFGAMQMVVIAADKQLALGELDPPELMASTFVKPTGKSIRNPRGATSARYRLTTTNGRAAPAFDGGAQIAQERDGSVVVNVDLSREDRSPALAEHLESSVMLAADDAVVEQLARRAVEGVVDTPIDRALALRTFVHEYVSSKNLSVGFATASEVARTREGDCTEHAVLLAAMLRAQGIPSRVVSGLVYTQAFAGARDVFGYHAWTQAHIDGRWVDLDATLPRIPFDAAHIALGASAMNDGELVNALVDIAPVLGTLKIEVLEIE